MSRNYLEAFAIIIVTFGLGFFLVLPKYQELQSNNARVQEKKAEIAARTEYYNGLKAIIDDLNYYRESMDKIETALPDDLDAPALMNFVQAAAMQSGLALQDINYTESGKGAALSSGLSLANYEISLKVSGSYENFKNFISIIEHSSRLISVVSLTVNSKIDIPQIAAGADLPGIKKDKDSDSLDKILDYEVKMSAYYYAK